MKVYTFHLNTDSVYREVHCFRHVKAYRSDVQAICDSLVMNSKDSCMTMYRDPIVWNANRQILGEVIKVYFQDSTIREAQVIHQALSVEQIPDKQHFNQLSSRQINTYFVEGKVRRMVAFGNVKTIFYPIDEKDSTLQGHLYMETDTLKMFLSADRKLEKMWTPKNTGVMYPMTQIPPTKLKLPEFAWFEQLRPTDPQDAFVWRGKAADAVLKAIPRRAAPLQQFKDTP